MRKIRGFIFIFIISFLLSEIAGASSGEITSFPVPGFLVAIMVKNSNLPFYSTAIEYGSGGMDGRKKGKNEAGIASHINSGYSTFGDEPSGSKEDNGGSNNKGNGEGGGDGRYPPDDGMESEDAASGDKDLNKAMADALEAIGTLLRQKKKLRLVLAMDIDQTLVWYPNSEIFSEEKRSQHMKQQQHWLMQFDEFCREYKKQIILVYNTTRSHPVDPDKVGADDYMKDRVRRSNQIAIGFGKATEGEGSTDFLDVALNNNPSQHIKLPLPDALITGTGSHLEVNERWDSLISNNNEGRTPGNIIQRVNRSLDDWRSEDLKGTEKAVSVLKDNGFWGFRYNIQSTYISAITGYSKLLKKAEQLIERHLPMQTQVITTATSRLPGYEKMFLHNNSLNKGTGLRVLLNIMSKSEDPDEPEPKVVIFGDNMTDLPALRPDQEGYALNWVSPQSMEIKNNRLQSLDLGIGNNDLAPNWLASIVPSKAVFTRSRNRWVDGMIKHRKVFEAPSEGVLGLMESLKTVVEQYDEPEGN